MIDDLENKLQPIGKTKKEITDFLGEPANISQDENRLEYFIGYGLIDPYTYDIILENGIVVKTEIMQH